MVIGKVEGVRLNWKQLRNKFSKFSPAISPRSSDAPGWSLGGEATKL